MSAALPAALIASTVLACEGVVRGQRRHAVRGRLHMRSGSASSSASSSTLPALRSWIRRPTGRVSVGLAAGVVGALLAGPLGAVIGSVAGIAGPPILERREGRRRRVLLDDQLADAVSAMGAGLRAGMSLTQAISYAADESELPLALELRRIVDRVALGIPLGRALGEWVASDDLPDVRLVDGVLTLHRRSGGDLPLVLDRLAETLRQRRSAVREVRSLTAQARMSGTILGFLPIGFFIFLSITSRADVQAALSTPAGITAVAVGLVMQGAAFLWIRSLLRVT